MWSVKFRPPGCFRWFRPHPKPSHAFLSSIFRYFIPSLFGAEKFTGGTPQPLLRITPLCLACDLGRRAGRRGSHGCRYAHQGSAAFFGLAGQPPFRVTGRSRTSGPPVVFHGGRACVEPRRSRQATGSWAHYSSRRAVTCYTIVSLRYSERPIYLIHIGPTSKCLPIQPSESPGPVTDRSSTVNGGGKPVVRSWPPTWKEGCAKP